MLHSFPSFSFCLCRGPDLFVINKSHSTTSGNFRSHLSQNSFTLRGVSHTLSLLTLTTTRAVRITLHSFLFCCFLHTFYAHVLAHRHTHTNTHANIHTIKRTLPFWRVLSHSLSLSVCLLAKLNPSKPYRPPKLSSCMPFQTSNVMKRYVNENKTESQSQITMYPKRQ